VSEVCELDHRHALEVVTLTYYADERNACLAGSVIVSD